MRILAQLFLVVEAVPSSMVTLGTALMYSQATAGQMLTASFEVLSPRSMSPPPDLAGIL